jgi:serine phosphatase RsbU (regulator of sigma subunit)/anti-anti-sigma regulatory factor
VYLFPALPGVNNMQEPADLSDKPKILVVDDEPDVRNMLVTALELTEDYEVHQAEDAASARQVLQDHPIDVAVTDLIMPDASGIELMDWAQKNLPGTTWIILSGKGRFDDAVRAVHLGAFDFICKPLPAVDSLVVTIRNALRQRQLEQERERLHLDIEERNLRLREQVVQLREACRLLGEQAQIINDDLRRAELIQRALLPREAPHTGPFAVNALYRPCQSVGGDIYECLRMDYRYVLGYVADAAGHGVSAAMLAVLFKHRLHMHDESTGLPTDPSEVLARVNHDLIGECRAPGLFVTAVYFVLDIEEQTVTLASAGHPPVFFRRDGGRIESFYHTGPALGITQNARYAQKTFPLGPSDRMLIYTDGLLEGVKQRFTSEMIAQRLGSSAQTGRQLLQEYFHAAIGSDEEEHLPDDVTLLSVALAEEPSILDNGQATPASQNRKLPGRDETEVLHGQEDALAAVSVSGKGTWTHSTAFHEVCRVALDDRNRLVIDLSMCHYLDSTMLGTIQELVDQAEQTGRELLIQGVIPEVADQFEELGMEGVLGHISEKPEALPGQMHPLAGQTGMDEQQGRRMLQAHEALAGLNDSNRQQFNKLVEGLRQELAQAEE